MLQSKPRSSVSHWPARIVAVGALILSVSAMGQQILYVDSTVTQEGDGSSWVSAMSHLQTALEAAAKGDVSEIRIAQGVFTPTLDETDRFAAFELVSGVAVRGGYAGLQSSDPDAWNPEEYETVLSGDLLGNDGPDFENYDENSYTVVRVVSAGPGTSLQGVTIRGGNADDPFGGLPPNDNRQAGGGIFCVDSVLLIDNCRFDANFARFGGGVYARESDLQVMHSRFIGNRSSHAGAALNSWESISPLVIHHSEFLDNTGETEGAVVNVYGPGIEVEHCHFSGNHGSGHGALRSSPTINYAHVCNVIRHSTFINNTAEITSGAVSLGGCPSVVENSLFQENSSNFACGALLITIGSSPPGKPRSIVRDCYFLENETTNLGAALCGTDIDVINSVFGRNVAGGNGGAVAGDLSPNPKLSFRNCTFAYNSGYAIRDNWEPPLSASQVTIGNSIFWGNTPGDFLDFDPATNISYSNIQSGWEGAGSNNISADPLFVNPGAMDYRLAAGSPSVNAGSNALIPPGTDTDIAGLPRILDGIVNMGAYEGEFEQEDSTLKLAIEPNSFNTFSAVGGPYQPMNEVGIVVFNPTESAGHFDVTQYLENPHSTAAGHDVLSHVVDVQTDIADGSFIRQISIPIRAEDLADRPFEHATLTNFEPEIGTWSLAPFRNTQLNPNTDHPVGIRHVDVDGDFLFSLTPGDYGVYWDSDLQRGYVWAVLDYSGTFNAGMRLCLGNVALPTDHAVDVIDLDAVLGAWGSQYSPYDVNYSGVVNIEDLFEVLATWGNCE